MTAFRHVIHEINCDGCGLSSEGDANTPLQEIRVAVRRLGWIQRGYLDYCLTCVGQGASEVTKNTEGAS